MLGGLSTAMGVPFRARDRSVLARRCAMHAGDNRPTPRGNHRGAQQRMGLRLTGGEQLVTPSCAEREGRGRDWTQNTRKPTTRRSPSTYEVEGLRVDHRAFAGRPGYRHDPRVPPRSSRASKEPSRPRSAPRSRRHLRGHSQPSGFPPRECFAVLLRATVLAGASSELPRSSPRRFRRGASCSPRLSTPARGFGHESSCTAWCTSLSTPSRA